MMTDFETLPEKEQRVIDAFMPSEDRARVAQLMTDLAALV